MQNKAFCLRQVLYFCSKGVIGLPSSPGPGSASASKAVGASFAQPKLTSVSDPFSRQLPKKIGLQKGIGVPNQALKKDRNPLKSLRNLFEVQPYSLRRL